MEFSHPRALFGLEFVVSFKPLWVFNASALDLLNLRVNGLHNILEAHVNLGDLLADFVALLGIWVAEAASAQLQAASHRLRKRGVSVGFPTQRRW